jgi:hypothetical protein
MINTGVSLLLVFDSLAHVLKKLIRRNIILLSHLAKHFGKVFRLEQAVDPMLLDYFFRSLRDAQVKVPLIRVGGAGDGAYLVPDLLENVQACFSPGVAETASFEEELAQRNIPCYLADFSVNASPIKHPLLTFTKKNLGLVESDECMTLESWISTSLENSYNLLLQMDIEGAEYEVVHATPLSTLRKFSIIVIEFHSLELLVGSSGFTLVWSSINKLLQDFSIVHMHPNNADQPINYKGRMIHPVVEFTFLRNDFVTNQSRGLLMPHPLDVVNVPNKPSVELDTQWYKASLVKF